MLKELTVKEALQLLADKYPEPVKGVFWRNGEQEKFSGVLEISRTFNREIMCVGYGYADHFAIETPDEYRYMTQQEANDFMCLNTLQVKLKSDKIEDVWRSAHAYLFNDTNKWLYRTIQEINGKIIYGEPQEFKVKV